jgi:hypothetical protein
VNIAVFIDKTTSCFDGQFGAWMLCDVVYRVLLVLTCHIMTSSRSDRPWRTGSEYYYSIACPVVRAI